MTPPIPPRADPRPSLPAARTERWRGAVFLEPQTYRRRRMMDAARLLPVGLAILLCLPLLWSADPQGTEPTMGAAGLLYLFGVWGLAIVTSALLSRALRGMETSDRPAPERPEGGGAS